MRDNYRKSLRKIAKRGQRGNKIRLYKYSEQLGFLSTYFDERDGKGNFGSQEDNQDDGSQHIDKEQSIHTDAGETTVSDLHNDLKCQSLPFPNNKGTFEVPEKSITKSSTKRVASQHTNSAEFMKHIVSNNENQVASAPTPHPVDAFLAGVAPTLKTLTPFYLHLAKSEIFGVVQKYEMKMLMGDTKDDPL